MGVLTAEIVIEESNTALVPATEAGLLLATLAPIKDQAAGYRTYAEGLAIATQDEAKRNVGMMASMTADVKTAKSALEPYVKAAFARHRNWTGLQSAIVADIEAAYKTAKSKGIMWDQEQARIARELQDKINRENEERARKEREALEAKAASMKTEAKKEEYLQKAEEVFVPPPVYIPPPKSGIKSREMPVAEVTDRAAFLAAAIQHPEYQGFIEIDTTKLARMWGVNPLFAPAGITFSKRTV